MLLIIETELFRACSHFAVTTKYGSFYLGFMNMIETRQIKSILFVSDV